jgi:Protein of unknown function (DUF1344)
MARWIATLLIVALVGWVGAVSAQQAPAPAPAPAPATGAEKTAEGIVKMADQAKKQITLEDGSMFTVPTTVQVSWKELTAGKPVLISYSEVGQLKTVKKVEIK